MGSGNVVNCERIISVNCCWRYMHPMALRSLKDLDLPQDRFPFVSSPSLPSPATNSHLPAILRLRTFQVTKWKFPCLGRSVRLIFLLGFVTIAFFTGWGSLTPRPTPNLEDCWRWKVLILEFKLYVHAKKTNLDHRCYPMESQLALF
jgi:hypothetical protein